MKAIFYSFNMFINQIRKDKMLWAVCLAPILTALFFYFGIPKLELLLISYLHKTSFLEEYYLLFDLFLSLITPYMFCFASAMVMLSEFDENMVSYLAVTPIGKKGYILSRLVLPAVISFIVSIVLVYSFSLTNWSFLMILLICLQTDIICIVLALFIFSFSHNKVEGMAMAKLSGLIMIGLPIPFFLFSKFQFMFSIFPSFWISKFVLEKNIFYIFPYIFTTILLFALFYGKFKRKII